MKDEGGTMKERRNFILHPSAFILTHNNTFTASFCDGLTVRMRSSRVIFSSSSSLGPTPQRTNLLFFSALSFLLRVSTMPMACDERYCTFSKSRIKRRL